LYAVLSGSKVEAVRSCLSVYSPEVKMKKFFSSTAFLVNGMYIIGVVVMFIGAWALLQIFGENVPEKYYAGLFSFVVVFWITGGVFTIRRREIPRWGLPGIKGKIAIVIGCFQLIVLSLGDFFILYYFFML
jgi:hypothetical protein